MRKKALYLMAELMRLRQKALVTNSMKLRPILDDMTDKQEQLNKLYFQAIFNGVPNNGE